MPEIASAVDITAAPVIPAPPLVFEDDHGRYRIGLDDDSPGFESRRYAFAVAERLRFVDHWGKIRGKCSLAVNGRRCMLHPPDPQMRRAGASAAHPHKATDSSPTAFSEIGSPDLGPKQDDVMGRDRRIA